MAVPLSCTLQPYAWGKIGSESTVAKFAAAAQPGFVVDPASPYAELWMGTHPNGPSTVIGSDGGAQGLAEYICANPDVLGKKVAEQFDGKLPFLFKVLSVGKSLSIQSHPDLDLAKALHAERPDIYKDPNHKPEICIALTPFEALCGFRPLDEIAAYAKSILPLRALLGDTVADGIKDKAGLKIAFTALMNAPKEALTEHLAGLLSLLEGMADPDPASALALRLAKQFPGDVGCFSVYFLNFVALKAGEGLFLGPNEAHAYLSGDCIECMAASDNVIRAGLTPKFIDVPVLCANLTYLSGPGDAKIMRVDSNSVYRAPVPEFDVELVKIDASAVAGARAKVALVARDGPSIVIVTDVGAGAGGCSVDGHAVVAGSVFFIPAGKVVDVNTGDGNLTLYRAFCEL